MDHTALFAIVDVTIEDLAFELRRHLPYHSSNAIHLP